MGEVQLTADEARRIALTAQGFAQRRPATVTRGALRKLVKRLQVLQLDPINVVVRAQYMPAFSRLGPYPIALLDELAYVRRELFEYIGHAASLVATELHPILRWRMAESAASTKWLPALKDEALAEVTERGALTPNDLTFQRHYDRVEGQWRGSYGKSAMRRLAWDGRVCVVGRRGIEQVYDLTERVLPAEVLNRVTPDPTEARSELVLRAAAALGVATAKDLADYFTMRHIGPLLAQLVAAGRLVQVEVKGWPQKAYLHPDAKARDAATDALLSPFDSLIWSRDRVARLFGFDYRIEIYVPAAQRRYGYYVYPFLLDGALVGRVDLKADRKSGALLVQGAFAEPTASTAQVAPALAAELHTMAGWLGLERVTVAKNGDLAPALRKVA